MEDAIELRSHIPDTAGLEDTALGDADIHLDKAVGQSGRAKSHTSCIKSHY